VRLSEYVMTLREGADPRKDASTDPVAREVTLQLRDHAPPSLLERLAKLDRMGLLNGDVLMSLIAQAPIDPLNLFVTLQQTVPDGWVFSGIDFGVVRVLARNAAGNVSAALRVDLMDSSVSTLVLNQAGQLTQFDRYEPDPASGEVLKRIQTMTDVAIVASVRESAQARPAR
jgi:hypothetical protein